MKAFGIICIGLGALSLLGALIGGHSVFGPAFWIAVGFALVFIAKQKKEDNKKMEDNVIKQKKQQSLSTSQSNKNVQLLPEQETASKQKNVDGTIATSKDNMVIAMTTKQKEAAICLIAYFGGYNDDIETDIDINQMVYTISYQAAVYFEIQNFPAMLSDAMNRNSDLNMMIDTVMSIDDKQNREFLLLSCFDLARMSAKPEAYELIFNIANKMGYDNEGFRTLIEQYSRK